MTSWIRILIAMLFVCLPVGNLMAETESASWGSLKAEFSSAPAGKLVVTKEKVGGKREIKPRLVISVVDEVFPKYVVEGTVDFPFAKYVLDARGSDEDVFITSLGLTLTLSQPGMAGKLVNCRLLENLDRWSDDGYPLTLPPNSITMLPKSFESGDLVVFNLDRGLVVKKGTTKAITLKSDVIYTGKVFSDAMFSWGLSGSSEGTSVVGILSSKTFTPKIVESVGRPMILKQQGELEVKMDPISPPFTLVKAGSLNVPVLALRIIGSYEPIVLKHMGFRADAPDIYTNPCAMTRFTVWHWAEQVGEGVFINDKFASVTLNKDVVIPTDSETILSVKIDTPPISELGCARSGDNVTVNYDGENFDETWGVGEYSGMKIISNSGVSTTSYGVRVESDLSLEELVKEASNLQFQLADPGLSSQDRTILETQLRLLRAWLHVW